MNAYIWLLLWQALLAGCSFWIEPDGWFWFLLTAAVIILVEWALSMYANKQGIQDFAIPFAGNKYDQSVELFYVQAAFTIVLSVLILTALSSQGLWHLFWLVLAISVLFFVLSAFSLKKHGRAS